MNNRRLRQQPIYYGIARHPFSRLSRTLANPFNGRFVHSAKCILDRALLIIIRDPADAVDVRLCAARSTNHSDIVNFYGRRKVQPEEEHQKHYAEKLGSNIKILGEWVASLKCPIMETQFLHLIRGQHSTLDYLLQKSHRHIIPHG